MAALRRQGVEALPAAVRYLLQQAGKPLAQGFKTLAEVEDHIVNHLSRGGLDWRVGYAFKARTDADFYEIINAKTGAVLKL